MQLNVNSAYHKALTSTKRYVLLFGGRGSGKSYYKGQDMTIKLLMPEYYRGIIARQNFSDIRGSQFQQIKDVIYTAGMEHMFNIRENTMQIECIHTKNTIIAKGFKTSSSTATAKMKSITEANDVWIEEADEVNYDDFMKLDLSLRTTKGKQLQLTLSYNTENEDTWLKTKFHDTNYDECEFIHTTYHCNIANLHPDYIRKMESLKAIDPEYYRVVVLGQWGSGKKGKIFEDYTTGEFPEHFTSEAYGLDFGFTNDPTALTHIRYSEGRVYIRQLIYNYGLTNQDIAKRLTELGVPRQSTIFADSAEPKSIEEIYRMGFNIKPTVKGADSINNGIQLMKQYPIVICNSPNLMKELKNYTWATDKNGNLLNKPIDAFNHCFEKNTPVLTEYGYKPLSEIKAGECIINSFGKDKVISNGITGYNKLWSYEIMLYIGSVTIICTEDHLFKTTLGWKKVKDLTKGDVIYQCKSLTGKSIGYTEGSAISVGEGEGCIPMFGCSTTGKYQKNATCTTKTTTQRTTIFPILNYCKPRNILACTSKIGMQIAQIVLPCSMHGALKRLKNGIEAQKALSGIGNMRLNVILAAERMVNQIVKFATLYLPQKQKHKNSAPTNAKLNLGEIQELTTLKLNVESAKIHFLQADTTQGLIVPIAVQAVNRKFHSTDYVWDLTIENNPEFIANGIVVHNCIDATRYAFTGLFGTPKSRVLAVAM